MTRAFSSSRIIVLEFGKSVLASAADLPAVVEEIYHHVREGARVVAVVANVRELQSALDAAGVPACTLNATSARHTTLASLLGAKSVDLKVENIHSALENSSVVVVPASLGIGTHGLGSRLLKRPGPDVTALFLAHRLRAACRLLRSSDGIYWGDPRDPGPRVARFKVLPWDGALQDSREYGVAAPIARQTLQYARKHGVHFEVGRPGGSVVTRVGGYGGSYLTSVPGPADFLRVGLLGHGTVGAAVLERLDTRPGVLCTRVAVRDVDRHLAAGLDPERVTDDPWQVVRSDVDVVIEATGSDAARGWIETALAAGKHVITAHKRLIAEHGPQLTAIAARQNTTLHYSAAVGGAVPVLEAIDRLAPRGIASIDAVLNGTSNFVLERLAAGDSLEQAVCDAQAAGFAESDPSRDLSGEDTADKLRIIARHAFGAEPDSLPVTGIENAAPGQRLLAHVQRRNDGIVARVAPENCNSPFIADTPGAETRLRIELADGQIVYLSGRGAGGPPTALSLLADLAQVQRERTGAATDSAL